MCFLLPTWLLPKPKLYHYIIKDYNANDEIIACFLLMKLCFTEFPWNSISWSSFPLQSKKLSWGWINAEERLACITGEVTRRFFSKTSMHVHYGSSYWDQHLQSKHAINSPDHGKSHAGLAGNRTVKLLDILRLIAGPIGNKYREPIPSGALLLMPVPNHKKKVQFQTFVFLD
jgi:hypothetical protein